MSSPLEGDGALPLALPTGERAAPGVRAGRTPEVGGQGGQRRARRRRRFLAKGERAPPLGGRAPGGAAALPLRPAGAHPRVQDELGAGRGLGGEDPPGGERDQAAVQTLAELDAGAGPGAAAGAGRQLEPAGTEADGVVVGDGPGVAAAEDEREIARGAAPGGGGIGG